MPYPAKTDRQAILSAAADQLAREGLRGLSLRSVADELGLAPNALYRYFRDRAALEAALTAECARRMHETLIRAAARKPPGDAIPSIARAYLRFAREQRYLYEMMLMPCATTGEDAEVHERLWAFVTCEVARIATPERAGEAGVALWAFLHGMASLEAAGVFGKEKPFSGFAFGLDAWLAAAAATGNAAAPEMQARKKASSRRGAKNT